MDNFDDKYKKKNPFTVPDGYFNDLTGRIMDQVKEEKKPRKMRFLETFKPYLGWAAVFIVTLIVAQALYPLAIHKNPMVSTEVTEHSAFISSDSLEEDIFDSHFNPTSDEIIEYLASEVDNYELMYAGIY